jgi:integrase
MVSPMHGVRAIMSRIYHYAEGHGMWEEGKRTPVSRAKLGKRRHKYERRILTFEETARVVARLEEPNLLIIETCIATSARISEVLGPQWKHVDLQAGTVKIEQRVSQYIVPRWGEFRLNQIQPQAVEDWLHTTFDSWWTMHGVRAIMSRIYG